MKKLCYSLMLLLVPLFVFGQVEYKEEKTKINSIKRNSNYIYGEGVGETEQEALQQAEEELQKEITILISEKDALKDADKIIVQTIKKNTSKIELKRGTSFRIFLYVKKEQIQNADHSIVMDNPVKATPIPNKNEVVEPEVKDVDLEEEIETTESIKNTNKVEITSPILNRIIVCQDMETLMQLFAQLKEEHKIMWGNVQTDIKPAWYILISDGNQISAILDKGLNNRQNLLTGEKVSLGSFSNQKKMWFIIYE